MLNNELNDLIKKYERYKRERFWARILLLGIFMGGLFYLFNYFKSAKLLVPKEDVNKSVLVSSEKEVNSSVLISRKKDFNKTENNQSKPKAFVSEMTDAQKSNLKELFIVDKKEHTYKSSIDIAKYYLSIEHYKEAIMWSVKASKLNNKSVKPWIVYAKAKQALGKDAMAIKALQIYLGQHSSDEARELLGELKK